MRASFSTSEYLAADQDFRVTKIRSGSRATFVSPYLRRPLRPLDKVLCEGDGGDDTADQLPANDMRSEAVASSWRRERKAAVVSD